MSVSDLFLTAIETTLLKLYYIEVLPRTFLAMTGVQSWWQEDVFSKKPIRRILTAVTTNRAYLGRNRTSPCPHQKFDLSQIVIYRNGLPIVGTPISTASNQRLYFNTLEAWIFLISLVLLYLIRLFQPFYYGLWLKFNTGTIARFHWPWIEKLFHFSWVNIFESTYRQHWNFAFGRTKFHILRVIWGTSHKKHSFCGNTVLRIIPSW